MVTINVIKHLRCNDTYHNSPAACQAGWKYRTAAAKSNRKPHAAIPMAGSYDESQHSEVVFHQPRGKQIF